MGGFAREHRQSLFCNPTFVLEIPHPSILFAETLSEKQLCCNQAWSDVSAVKGNPPTVGAFEPLYELYAAGDSSDILTVALIASCRRGSWEQSKGMPACLEGIYVFRGVVAFFLSAVVFGIGSIFTDEAWYVEGRRITICRMYIYI